MFPGDDMYRMWSMYNCVLMIGVYFIPCCQCSYTFDFSSDSNQTIIGSLYRTGTVSKSGTNATVLLDQLLRGHDNRLRPGHGNDVTNIEVNLNIRSMGPISENDMTYQLDCYFRQSWLDKRLAFNGNFTNLPVSISILDRIWTPDTHFVNGHKSRIHAVTSPNKLLRINSDGRILYSMRLTIIAGCQMKLERFPMDIQMCPLIIGSHAYSSNEIRYVWKSFSSIKIASDMALSQFDLVSHPTGNCTHDIARRGNFSMLFVNFYLRRHTGYFIINIYIPCSLLVVLSWVGFWINREATSDRISLGITIVLTMTFIGIDNRADSPPVPYPTSLDVFIMVCFMYISSVMVEFAAVHYFTKFSSGDIEETPESEGESDIKKIFSDSIVPHINALVRPSNSDHCCVMLFNCLKGSPSYRKKRRCYGDSKRANSVSKIDIVSRWIFPATFLLFQVIYWYTYLRFTYDVMKVVSPYSNVLSTDK